MEERSLYAILTNESKRYRKKRKENRADLKEYVAVEQSEEKNT
jgi:hypothetical protein